jgi:magnesium-transporting ATPase (P-type)
VTENLKNITFLILVLVSFLYLWVTYRNARMYKEICNSYKSKTTSVPASACCFKYFNFNITYFYVPTEKIIYVYFPLIFKKTVSTNKSIPKEWCIFINSLPNSKKAWLYFEIFLLKMSGILMVLLVALWMQG